MQLQAAWGARHYLVPQGGEVAKSTATASSTDAIVLRVFGCSLGLIPGTSRKAEGLRLTL